MHTNLGHEVQCLKHVMPSLAAINKWMHEWMDGLAPRFSSIIDALTCCIHIDNQHMSYGPHQFQWEFLKYQIPNLREGVITREYTSHHWGVTLQDVCALRVMEGYLVRGYSPPRHKLKAPYDYFISKWPIVCTLELLLMPMSLQFFCSLHSL